MYALLQTGRKRASPDVAKDTKKSDAKRSKSTASKSGKKQQEEAEEPEDAEAEPDAAADLEEDVAAGSDADSDSEEAEADASEDADEEMEDATAAADPPADAVPGRTVGSGRRAAQGKKVYKDQKQLPKKGKADEVKQEAVVKTEKKAWEETAPKEQEDSKTRRWGGALCSCGSCTNNHQNTCSFPQCLIVCGSSLQSPNCTTVQAAVSTRKHRPWFAAASQHSSTCM